MDCPKISVNPPHDAPVSSFKKSCYGAPHENVRFSIVDVSENGASIRSEDPLSSQVSTSEYGRSANPKPATLSSSFLRLITESAKRVLSFPDNELEDGDMASPVDIGSNLAANSLLAAPPIGYNNTTNGNYNNPHSYYSDNNSNPPSNSLPRSFQYAMPPKAFGQNGTPARSFVSNSTASASGRHHAHEIGETFSFRLLQMKWTFLAFIVNITLLVYFLDLLDGIILPIPMSQLHAVGGVSLELVLLVTNVITELALEEAFAAVAGYLLTRHGLSMVVCGFAQANSIKKFTFGRQLSYNSKVRGFLTRISYLWVLMEICKIISTVIASALSAELIRVDVSKIGCVTFGQTGFPKDRNFPSVESELGFSELVFGRSLGVVRSQYETNVTIALVGPQMAGSFLSGDNIIGDGFTVHIRTNCSCLKIDHTKDLINAGFPLDAVTYFQQQYPNLPPIVSIANSMNYTSTHIDIFTMIGGAQTCGGRNTPELSVCHTVMENHFKATIEMTYMDDGNPSSVAQSDAKIRSYHGAANIDTWLAAAMKNILGGWKNVHPLPSTVPGLANTLMWWTTTDLTALDPPLLEAGLETMFAILYRAAIQRSYSSKPTLCLRNQELKDRTKVKLKAFGYYAAIFLLCAQLAINFICMLCFIPWFLSKTPIMPAVRAVHESIYFSMLLMSSSMSEKVELLNNAPTPAIWQKLDLVVKIGEHFSTVDDEIGAIVMDRPKVVKPLMNGRRYA